MIGLLIVNNIKIQIWL